MTDNCRRSDEELSGETNNEAIVSNYTVTRLSVERWISKAICQDNVTAY